MLVGCKTDLRKDEPTLETMHQMGMSPITYEEGVARARQIGAVFYKEGSAKTQTGVKEIFEDAMKFVLAGKNPAPKKSCILL